MKLFSENFLLNYFKESLLYGSILCLTFLLVNHGYSQTILKKQGDNLLEIKSALEKNEHDKALLLIKQDLPFVIENRDSSLIVSYSYFQSKIHQEREQLDSSINVLIFAYRYARRAEDEVKVNYQLGEILLQMGAHELAICADIDASVSYIIEANIEEPLCEGSTVTLNFLDFENYEGITYQWQKELNGEWLDIEGETENTFVGELTESTEIRLALTCNENVEWIYTETLSLEVTPIPSDNITLNHAFFGEKTVDFTVENTHNSYSYDWAFGDGETETTEAPGVAHEYADFGEYTMTLNISNDCGEYVITEIINIQNVGIATENIIQAQIFPNPAKDFITITLDNANAATALLFDATGREVKTLAMNKSTTIAVGDWSKGVYFAHILTENTKSILQFIVK